MNKKTILFIGLMVCFLGVLAYVENIERQKQEQAELEQTEIKQAEISEAEAEINWDNITPEYFLTEDIFGTDARIGLVERKGMINIKNVGEYEMFKRSSNNKDNIPFVVVTVKKFKNKNFDLYTMVYGEPGSVKKVSKDTTATELGSFTFQNEVVRRTKIEIEKEQDTDAKFILDWYENKFTFSVETISSEYQDDIEEIAKNIINKYPNNSDNFNN